MMIIKLKMKINPRIVAMRARRQKTQLLYLQIQRRKTIL